MMIIFNIFQTVSFYGFLNWVPTIRMRGLFWSPVFMLPFWLVQSSPAW
jgi:hypothetical protein